MSVLSKSSAGPPYLAGLLASWTIAGGFSREIEPEAQLLLPAPTVEAEAQDDVPERPTYTDRQTQDLRRHVMWLRRSGRKFLAAGELAFLGYLAKWAHPLTIDQGDRVMTLVDRVDDQLRGRL